MPTLLKFKINAIVYFKGERPKFIYLIKEGSIRLNTADKGSSNSKNLSKGDFFGMFSTIGGYPRQEDAVSSTDVEILAFEEREFEDLIANNPQLSLQFMQILSQELRKVHKRAKTLLNKENNAQSSVSLSDGLLSYANMYSEQGDVKKEKYVLNKFIETYHDHPSISRIKERMLALENRRDDHKTKKEEGKSS